MGRLTLLLEKLNKEVCGSKGLYSCYYNSLHDYCEVIDSIQEELGIPLEVLFKALKDGVYGLNRENEIEHLYTPRLYFVKDYECYCLREGIFLCEDDFKLKDYGKTWWLEEPKEKLKNDI